MHLDVLIFGSAAVVAKADRVRVRLGDAPTLADVARVMAEQHPDLAFALTSPRFAVNHAFANMDTRIAPTDEVALITLVGGG
ncbi:MAG: MoaD/ThiS family protein [Phycisphaerales bacterium]|nr:MoaD/ThiS family protein [Phycisphaerales bacterium]